MTRTIWLASYPKSGNTWFRMLVANLAAKDGKPADINDLPERGGIASARAPFDYLLLIDSGLLTHDEIDCLRPHVYEELARGAEDDEYDARQDAPPVRFVKVHDAYTLTPQDVQRALQEAGLRADSGSLQFNLRGDGQTGGSFGQTADNSSGFSGDGASSNATPLPVLADAAETYYLTPGGVNMRV